MHKVHIHLEYFEQQLVVWVYLQLFEWLVWVSDGFSVSACGHSIDRAFICVSVWMQVCSRHGEATEQVSQEVWPVQVRWHRHFMCPCTFSVMSKFQKLSKYYQGGKNSVEYMHYLDTFRALILYICYSPLPTSVLTLLYLKVALYICLRSGRLRGRRQTALSTVRCCNMNLPIKGP